MTQDIKPIRWNFEKMLDFTHDVDVEGIEKENQKFKEMYAEGYSRSHREGYIEAHLRGRMHSSKR